MEATPKEYNPNFPNQCNPKLLYHSINRRNLKITREFISPPTSVAIDVRNMSAENGGDSGAGTTDDRL